MGPTLQAGDLVICDNLAIHGAQLLCRSACRPDFNPIEQAFAKLKEAHNWEELLCATATALTTFTPAHYAHFFRHAYCTPT